MSSSEAHHSQSAMSLQVISREGEEEKKAFLYAMQLCNIAALPMAIKAVIELGVLDLLVETGGRHLSTKEIATTLRISNPDAPVVLDRILRLLASHDVVGCSLNTDPSSGAIARSYGPAPVCKYLAKVDKDGVDNRFGSLLVMYQDRVMLESMCHIKEAVTEGRSPFHVAHGASVYEIMARDSRFREFFFNNVLSNPSTIIMKNIIDNYMGFEEVKTLVDVGGGYGACIHMIVSKYPHIRGINFDLPHVASEAPSLPGIEHVGGDMFDSIPNGDAIFMKWIVCGWNDDYCVKLLKNCWKALPYHGKLIIVESILPEAPNRTLSAQFSFEKDIRLLAHSPGGKERTIQEFDSLGKKVGFSKFNIACEAFGFWIIEMSK